jgi:tetratricopeptide (TPR) repeat protein
MKKFQKKVNILQLFLIASIALLAYSNTFYSPFVFDDIHSIVENPKIRQISNFFTLEGLKSNRYIGQLSFALNYWVHGLDVVGYHVVNLVIHIINGLLVYLLVIYTFRAPRLEGSGIDGRAVAVFSSLLFVAHPVQTQAVTYIVQRYASMATMFYLGSVVFYVRWRLGGRVWWYVGAVVLAVLGMKTKEICFTLPVVVFLYEVIFFGRPERRRFLYLIPLFLTMVIIPLSLLGANISEGNVVHKITTATRAQTVIPRTDYLFTELRVIVTYIRLLLFPVNQKVLYDYPIFRTLFNPQVLLSLMGHLILLGVAVVLLLTSRKNESFKVLRITAFGIFWFYVTLSVESGVIPVADVIFEHRLYLPSVGIFIGMSTILFYFVRRIELAGYRKSFWVAQLVFIAVVLLLVGLTYSRNRIWQDELTFWQDVVRKNQRHPGALSNLAGAYFERGQIEKALQYYKRAIELCPDFAVSYNGLGSLYLKTGQPEKALNVLKKAVQLNPTYVDAINNLGIACLATGALEAALTYFRRTTELSPYYYKGYYNMGMVLIKKKELSKAIEALKKSIAINPSYIQAYLNLGIAYAMNGDLDKAENCFRQVIKINHLEVSAYNNLGLLYYKKGLFNKAIEVLMQALEIAPDNKKTHYNLAFVYRAMGMVDKAKEHFRKAGVAVDKLSGL